MTIETKIRLDVGDTCLCEFREGKVLEMKHDRIVFVQFKGSGKLGGHDLKCFPLTDRGLEVSKVYQGVRNTLGCLKGVNLNFPRIADWMEKHWAGTMNVLDSPDAIGKSLSELGTFEESIVYKVLQINAIEIYGFSLLRP